jgi:PAS domain S-box-containing protein
VSDCHERIGVENEFSRVVDALPGLVWTMLPDGQVDFLNQRWSEYTGLSIDKILGSGWQRAIHPEDLQELVERWRFVLSSGEPRDIEARLRGFDGEYRWFLFRTAPLSDASGQVVKWCGMGTDIDDRKRAEKALVASEPRFRMIVDGLPTLVTLMTPGGALEDANRHLLEYYGETLEELKAWPRGVRFHPADRPRVLEAWRKSVETGLPYEVEGRLGRADGVYRWFHTRGLPLRDSEGCIVLWYILQTDIDDLKRAEALLAGEKRLLEMVAAGQSMSAILEALCHFVESAISGCYCSIVLVDASGARLEHGAAPSLPANFITSIIGDPVNLDSGPCALAAYRNEQVIAADLKSDTRWAARAWTQIALAHGLQSCCSTPILSAAGKVLGAFAIYYAEPKTPTPQHQALIDQFINIASIAVERAQSDAALKRSEAFLAEAQRLSRTGSFSWRAGTDEITWSEETYRIFGVPQGVPVTFDLIESRIHPEDLPTYREMIKRTLGDSSDIEYDHRLQMPDQSVKYLHMVAHGTRDQNGDIEYVGATQDVTQRRLSDEALAKARLELARVARVSSLGTLTASIAHEVNQPLSGIITNASTCLRMLAADPPNVGGARETARRTIRDGNRASDVIKRLRALFANNDATTEAVNLNEAAREVIALLLRELQRNRVILRAELADNLPPVTGDRVQLQQVILNLLLNAQDAMSGVDVRPRLLVLRTERDDGHVRLTVQDAGVGLDPQNVDRLFEAFYTTKSGGMGIGLSVSRSIIESHRGRLWAAQNDGPGAMFAFSVPGHFGEAVADHSLGAIWASAVTDAQHDRKSP